MVQIQPEQWPSIPLTGLPGVMGMVQGEDGQGFLLVGQFNREGLAEGDLPAALGRISVMRLMVTTKSPNWVILSEVKQRTA